jgi:hypothetical protein
VLAKLPLFQSDLFLVILDIILLQRQCCAFISHKTKSKLFSVARKILKELAPTYFCFLIS